MPTPDEADAIAVHIACGSLAEECIAEGAAQIRALVNAKLSQAATISSVAMYADRELAERAWDAIRSLKMGDEP